MTLPIFPAAYPVSFAPEWPAVNFLPALTVLSHLSGFKTSKSHTEGKKKKNPDQ